MANKNLKSDFKCFIDTEQLTEEAAVALREQSISKLKQIISRAKSFMRHGNRDKLTCNDINRSLKWSNSQQLYGYECKANQNINYIYSEAAGVYHYGDDTVDLKSHIENLQASLGKGS